MEHKNLNPLVEEQTWVYFKRGNYTLFEKMRELGYANPKNCPLTLRKEFSAYEERRKNGILG
jgi:hypothetical protein